MVLSAREILSRTGTDGVVGAVHLELCWEALESTSLGRLAVVSDGKVDIFPINYVVDGTKIYFRTAPGSKLHALTAHSEVALEIDGVDDDAAFSIVAKGKAERVVSPSELAVVDALPLTSWIPTLKLRWVRIRPTVITGRVFGRGAEPNPYV